ncbi:hypothetical protein SAMN05445850_8395 [Paraburkholderia tuberum]|uniref:Uncharacterized protein n=2 Tax=Paraburkholderia tuberum TaxID=157910 RepID=A0A1H1KKB5_9BURK|nr:hypothetical protein SAMN05445850_8395 [Paraburkholderia tuberum]
MARLTGSLCVIYERTAIRSNARGNVNAASMLGEKSYEVVASSRRTINGAVPTLKVTRLYDKRVIYPFCGCPDMPLFDDPQSAKNFAEVYGWQLVKGDIAVPE